MPKATGTRTVGGGGRHSGGSVALPPENSPATLAEIGITKKQSATAQKLADIPKEEFAERVAVAKASKKGRDSFTVDFTVFVQNTRKTVKFKESRRKARTLQLAEMKSLESRRNVMKESIRRLKGRCSTIELSTPSTAKTKS
jgi:hypothetical protein